MDQRQRYLDSETEAGKELAKWMAQEPPGLFREELALLRWQLSQAAKNGQGILIRDLANAIVSVEKVRRSQELASGALWSPAQRQQFIGQFSAACEQILRDRLPQDWADVMEAIAAEYGQICSGITTKEASQQRRLR